LQIKNVDLNEIPEIFNFYTVFTFLFKVILPLHIQFTNLSTGSGSQSYFWTFGNGNSSNETNPVATYSNPGVYTVTLNVTEGSDSASKSSVITVYKSPVADFSSLTPAKGCVPMYVNFNDSSTNGDGNIIEWSWNFNDGSFTNSNPNQLHYYSLQGNYTVSLLVRDENGCTDFKEFVDYVRVSRKPSMAYFANPNYGCEPPFSTTFINYTNGNGNLSFLWDFGDGDSSTLVSPTHTYNDFGTFAVSLTATDSNTCSNSYSFDAVKVEATNASFFATQFNDTIHDNDTICQGMVSFFNTTPGNLMKLWSLGDGTSAFGDTVINFYYQPGNYTITLIAGIYSPCPDTTYLHITVDNVNAQFAADTLYTCEVPFTVNLTNQSVNAQSWIWNFGNGEADSTNSQTTQVTYTEPKSSIITLNVISPNGCTSMAIQYVTINLPEAKFHIHNSLYGCKPLNLNFSDSSKSTEQIVVWDWFFGDGDSINLQNPFHSYTNDGEFEAFLVITNEKGCKDTSNITTISVGKPLHPNFSISQTEVCKGDSVQFTDLTTPAGFADTWHYDVPEHHLSSCPYDPNATLAFYSDSGLIDVSLTVGYNGCFSDTTIQNAVKVNGSVVSFSYSLDCATPDVYNFTGNIDGAETFFWNFNDGSPVDSVQISPVHTFLQQSGDFDVVLIANNQTTGCSDTVVKTINVRKIHASFSINGIDADTIIACKNLFQDYQCNSQDEYTYCHEGHIWKFDDNIPPYNREEEIVSFGYPVSGIFHPTLYIQDINGCKDSVSKTVVIYGLDANFTTDVTSGCSPLTITCTNFSTTETLIDSIRWIYGDSTLATLDSTHTYQNAGLYNAMLTVRDTLGCFDSHIVSIIPANPNPQFYSQSSIKICAGDSVKFERIYNNIDSILWDFGDNTLSNDLTNPIWHQYSDSGFYYVTLYVYESGCKDSLILNTPINVQSVTGKFFAHMSDFEADTNCYPLELVLTYNKIPNYIQSWYWDFGVYNAQSNLHDSVYISYNFPGTYIATLNVTTTNGCQASDSMEIVVKGPVAQFTMSPDTICKGEPVSFFIRDTLNVYGFEWDFGDGVSATGDNVSHRYNQVGIVYPALIITADDAHTCDRSLIDTLYIRNILAKFNILNSNDDPDSSGCSPFSVSINNNSIGDISNIEWNIDNVFSSSSQNISYIFLDNSLHFISLMIESNIGCFDTLTKSVFIFSPEIYLPNDTFICQGNTIQLIIKDDFDSYSWSPSKWISDTSVFNPYVSPEESINYYVSIADTNGCLNNDSIHIQYQSKPEISLNDTTVIIGESVFVDSDSENGITYSWSPSEFLSCSNCANPVINVLDTTVFYVTMTDNYECFVVIDSIKVSIKEGYTVDLPVVFTPNGDGHNDIIFVRGWGIKDLNEYKIFNRWGQVIFETSDIKTGWDGTYQGKAQNSDSYIYNVAVTYYSGKTEKKVGYVNLIR